MDELAVLHDFRRCVDAPSYDAVRARLVEEVGLARGARVGGSRRTRRPLVLGAALVAALAVAVPAFGLAGDVIDFFSAPAAPPATQESFTSMDVGAPAGMAPGVSGPARSVLTTTIGGKTVHLWVAPTHAGGFCVLLEGSGGGCDRDRQLPINVTLTARTPDSPVVLSGDALSPQADHLELRYADGHSVSIPLVRVSEPVDAGFFVYVLDATLSGTGPWPTTIAAVSAAGSIVASTPMYSRCSPTPRGCLTDSGGSG